MSLRYFADGHILGYRSASIGHHIRNTSGAVSFIEYYGNQLTYRSIVHI